MTPETVRTRIVPIPTPSLDMTAMEALEFAAAGYTIIASHTDSPFIRDFATMNAQAASAAARKLRSV